MSGVETTAVLNLAFPRNLRLLSGGDFKQVFGKAKRSRDEFFTVLMRNVGGDNPRLGLAISKKELKHAVDRNRIKRLTRESFRLNQHDLPTADFIVMTRKKAGEVSNQELFSRLEKHWQRLAKLNSAKPNHEKSGQRPKNPRNKTPQQP